MGSLDAHSEASAAAGARVVAQLGSLTLLTNVVMTGNTVRIQRSLNEWRAMNWRRTPTKLLRHVSHAGFEHINFDGVFWFPVEQFRSRHLPSSAEPVVHAA